MVASRLSVVFLLSVLPLLLIEKSQGTEKGRTPGCYRFAAEPEELTAPAEGPVPCPRVAARDTWEDRWFSEQEVALQSRPDTPRLTPQRRAVLEALRGSSDHPTAAELLPRVQQRSPGTGAATVYRALAVLVEAGLAEELSIGDGHAARFDGNTDRHDHLVCTRCGRVVDVVQPQPDLSGVAGTGFTVTGYDLRIHGTCPDCQTVATG